MSWVYNGGMLHTLKAYANSKGRSVLVLTHDVKRCLRDSGAIKGMVTILSTDTAVGVTLKETVKAGTPLQPEAPLSGLSLTLAFDQGKLLMSPYHDIVGLDQITIPGRREFIVTVMGEAKVEAKA